ncbi:uncharacterized protein BDV14DRAFT_196866 [Aspergillus stella-maris]|uniref:uncharacterized protein n=1 Tax=Aspergillus stella-maris TaxID=1810926 RepID=UPI003CCCC98B
MRLRFILKPPYLFDHGLLMAVWYGQESVGHFSNTPKIASHPVVFDSLSSMPEDQKAAEVVYVLLAGVDTSSSVMTTALLHILKNPRIKVKLMQTLDDAVPATERLPSLLFLEKIEYLVSYL